MHRCINAIQKVPASLLVLVVFMYFLAKPTGAQELKNTLKQAVPGVKIAANVDSRIIPGPVRGSDVQPQSCKREWPQFRTSGALGTYGFGFKFSLHMADSPWHGSLFAGSITDPQRRISDADYITLTGFSAAYLWPLNRPGTAAGSGGGGVIGIPGNSVQYYLQVGPGLGMGGVGRVDDELEIHPYFYTDGALGAIIPVSRNRAGRSLFSGASFYTELGGLLAWFPTLSEMHFVVGPHITFGFNLFSGSDIPAVDY